MIRINLLGRDRPKAERQSLPLEATLQLVSGGCLVISMGVLYYHWHSMNTEADALRAHIQRQMGEKARLDQLKAQVDNFEAQKGVLQKRINVIETLQRNGPAARS